MLFDRKRLRQEIACPGGYAEIWHVAWPLILSNAVATFMLLCNGAFLAHHGTGNLAAISPAGAVISVFQQLLVITCGFVATLVAQNLGARRPDGCVRATWNGLYLAALCSAVAVLGIRPFGRAIFSMSRLSPELIELQIRYFNGMIPCLALSCLSIVLSSFFSATGRTKIVGVVSIITGLTTIPLNYALISGNWGFPPMGISGAAIASTASVGLGFAAYLVLFLTQPQSQFATRRRMELSLRDISAILRFGVPSGVQGMLRQVAATAMLFCLGNLGDVAAAAVAMSGQMNNVAWFPLTGLMEATAVVTGKYVGEKQLEHAAGVFGRALAMLCSYMAFIAVLYVFAADSMLRIYGSSDAGDEVFRMARFIMFAQIVQNFFDSIRYINSGFLKGAGDTRVPMLITLLSGWLVEMPMAWLLAFCLKPPVWVAWMGSCTLAVIVDAIIINWRRRTGKWRQIKVLST